MHIYFDHNVLIDMNKARLAGDMSGWHAMLSKLESLSARPVLSAWHMVENAKAREAQERQAYNSMISELRPCFLSNNNYVKGQELVRYLFKAGFWMEDGDDRPPFHDSVAAMWTSYGGPVFIAEQFGDFVEHIVADPGVRTHIMSPLAEAPAQMKSAREAILKNRDLISEEAIVDRAWLLAHLPERDRGGKFVKLQFRETAAQFATECISDVLKACPTVLADDLRYRNALLTNSSINANDAADTQHVIVALAHCEVLISRDRALRRFVNEAGMKCKAVRSLDEI